VALTIAGTDSGAGAGVAADLRTFAAHDVFGTFAVSAVTAQNTVGVQRVQALPALMVVAQIETVVSDLHPVAAKTGMLATPEIVSAVTELVAAGTLRRSWSILFSSTPAAARCSRATPCGMRTSGSSPAQRSLRRI
jgi:hydroxymethylpyrimidine/phosphomethylpyrimidine kinase